MTDTPTLDDSLASLVDLLATNDRDDLADRVHAARVRARRPQTVVCVVGEFKQGKSSLVNGLVGREVCPVDDDIATARITMVRHGETERAIVRLREDGQAKTTEVSLDDVASYIVDTGEADARRDIDRVDIEVPAGPLADGLVLVDTPGMGGLGAGHAAATLSFLPFADGLMLVTDATRELTAPEVEFLHRASELCPNLIVVETKTDLSPDWRRIVELDRGHLDRAGVTAPIVAVSSALRAEALELRDRSLNDLSGYPAMLDALFDNIVDDAAETAEVRAATEASAIASGLHTALASRLAQLDDREAQERLKAEAEQIIERLETLKAQGSRWSTVLGDRTTDLSTDVMHRFRGRLRELQQDVDQQIDELKDAEAWEEMSRTLQTTVADAVTSAFVAVEDGRIAIRDELAALLAADDAIEPHQQGLAPAVDVGAMWKSRDLTPNESQGGKLLRSGLTGLRGAQGGIVLFGVSGQFLPQATALFLASNPVLLGAGAFFGGFQLFEDRKRRVQQRRQGARQQLRQFTDEVQFEVGNELGRLVRQVQRDLRDEFGTLIGELQRSWSEAHKQATATLQQGDAERAQQRTKLTDAVADVEAIIAALQPKGDPS